MPLGVLVTTSEVPQTGGVSTNVGTAFIVGPSNYGPEVPTLTKSLNEVVALYGPSGRETGFTQLYDGANAFFANEGARAYINRAGEGDASLKAALLELETTSKTKVLIVTAKYKGTYGNKLKLEVKENEAKTKTKLVILNPNSEVLEESPEFAEAKELASWGESHKTYVEITHGSNYATGETELVKKLSATVLATGANPADVKEKGTIKSIEGFQKTLGPGQIIVPGNSGATSKSETEKIHTAMGEHALIKNRFAVCDIFESETTGTTAATIVTNKGTVASGIGGYVTFTSSAVTTGGASTTPATTRTVAASGVLAGLFARVSATGNNNQAPAGRNWPLTPFVTGVTNIYTEPNMEKLNTEGINNITERFGILCLYGDRNAISPETDGIFFQYSASRERMALVAEAEEIGEKYLFSTLDGRHQKRAQFQGALQALIKKHWEAGALYGETANEAGQVNVGEPVNTPQSESEGYLKAEVVVRISPTAEAVRIQIVSRPITEAI